MNLYFRLICLLLRLPFMKKNNDPLKMGTLNFTVWPFDLDFNLHVNNGRYLTLMDLGRVHLTALNGILWPSIKKGWMPVLGSAKIHFLKPLNLFNRFQIQTQVVYWDEKWIYLEQNFFHQDKLCATALVKALFISKKNKIPPETLLHTFYSNITRPDLPDNVKDWIACEKRE
tara:strand:- start:31227 stop:31742 length:516 start_codon:yes stop_codon:yes gene_type:complete